ncbi:MAG TPA: PAS domain-containing protein, partial [Pseudoduganella sp.]
MHIEATPTRSSPAPEHHAEVQAEFQAIHGALNRVQAIIEFRLDGTIIHANDNFLETLGYTLDEVTGRHHSMFCDPDYVRSADYEAFWTRLRRGEFERAQYRRIG